MKLQSCLGISAKLHLKFLQHRRPLHTKKLCSSAKGRKKFLLISTGLLICAYFKSVFDTLFITFKAQICCSWERSTTNWDRGTKL